MWSTFLKGEKPRKKNNEKRVCVLKQNLTSCTEMFILQK